MIDAYRARFNSFYSKNTIMNLFKQFLFISLVLSFLFSCTAPSETTQDEPSDNTAVKTESATESTEIKSDELDKSAYSELDQDMYMEDYQGQKIWLKGRITQQPMQHMMKDPPPFGAPEKHQTIDFNDGEQTVVYYSGIDVPEDEQEHLYYGTVDKISGAGKGGGTHTEYFLILDHVD